MWGVYRDVQTIDPALSFDYPDNAAVSLMCESVLKQESDGSIGSGLASLSRTDPKTMVFTIKPQAKFWDGSPVTAQDVVYSLRRQADPKDGGLFSNVFSRVSSISSTGPEQVTIKLSQPDYWLDGELAGMPGVVLEERFTEKHGKKYGSPAGGVMCTGAYKLKSWQPATGVVAEVNHSYWNSSANPKVSEITMKGVPDESTLVSSLLTGAISGSYPVAMAELKQLESSSKVTVTQGPGYSTTALVVSNLKGVLGDVRVRQALSLAVDRQGEIDSIYGGAATPARWFSNPGTFGYGKSTFQTAYDKAPKPIQDIAKAKKLIEQAGAKGKTFTLGMSSEIHNVVGAAAFQEAGRAIGLHVKFKSVSAANFINFFSDPKFRSDVDGFPAVDFGDYADPATLLAHVVLPDGLENFSGFNDTQITDWMEQARATADPDARAQLITKVEQRVSRLLPWIPTVQPNTVLILNRKLTGAVSSFAYMYAPWANQLGAR